MNNCNASLANFVNRALQFCYDADDDDDGDERQL